MRARDAFVTEGEETYQNPGHPASPLAAEAVPGYSSKARSVLSPGDEVPFLQRQQSKPFRLPGSSLSLRGL